MWMMNIEHKGKKLLAALLALCMILQLPGWTPWGLQAIAAGREDQPLKKEMIVSEKEILRAVEMGETGRAKLLEEIIPYQGEQREIAMEELESILSRSILVKQKSLGSRCSAIIAVEMEDKEDLDLDDAGHDGGHDGGHDAGSDSGYDERQTASDSDAEEEFEYSRILMIGLNGNKWQDCEFTMKITGADGIVVRKLVLTGYRQDRVIASDSNAAENFNAGADESALLSRSSAVRPDDAGIAVRNSVAWPDDAGIAVRNSVAWPDDADIAVRNSVAWPDDTGITGSSSNAWPEQLDGEEEAYRYIEEYKESYGQDAASLLVSGRKDLGTALFHPVGKEEIREEEGTKAPKMMAAAGGFAVASLLKNPAEMVTVGKIADVNVYIEEGSSSIQSGRTFAIFANAAYSAVSNSKIDYACFSIQFETDVPEDLITGPEESAGAVSVEELSGEGLEDWKRVKEQLETDNDGDWQRITIESSTFFYSKNRMQAVFSINRAGDSVTGIPFRFRFANGLTPDGSFLTATPEVLNKKELEDDYFEINGGVSAEGKVQSGEPVHVKCEADFAWSGVEKKQEGSLGNLNGASDNGAIVYTISATPKYGSDKIAGVMYTKGYTITDEMYFDHFYIDGTGGTVVYTDIGRKGEFGLNYGGQTLKLIGLDLPQSAMKNGVAEPIYETGSRRIIGVRIAYTVENPTLDTENPEDLFMKSKNDANNSNERARVWFHYGNFKGTDHLIFTGEGIPKVTNDVYLDAYSIMYDGTEFPGSAGEDGIKKKDHHHSHAQVSSVAGGSYPITKKAYRDSNCTMEAAGEKNQIFEPGETVYYQISVTNKGYAEQEFRVEDQIPEQIQFESAELTGLKIGDRELEKAKFPESVRDAGKNRISWDHIKLLPGETAVLTLRVVIKEKDGLSGNSGSSDNQGRPSNFRLDNKAEWFVSGTMKGLNKSTASIYVTTGELKASEVKFEKASNAGGTLAVGETVQYTLNAKLRDETIAPQRIVLTDHWPKQLTLTQISNIPSGAVVTLNDGDGEVIASYVNHKTGSQTAAVPKDFNMLKDDVEKIRDVVISNVYVDGKTEKKIVLSGKVKTGGTITNTAGTSAGNSAGASFTSLAMKIEKRAYRIAAAEKNSITEENSTRIPAGGKVTFAAGDVVCYEVKVTNPSDPGQQTVSPVIIDDISGLFASDETILAEAELNGIKGPAFYRKNSGNWKMLPVSGGVIRLSDVNLSPQEAVTVRIYISVPEGAVGSAPASYTNTAVSTLTIDGNEYSVSASAPVITLRETDQRASVKKEVIAVARDFTKKNGTTYLEHAVWKDKDLFGEGAGYTPGSAPFVAGTGDYVFYRVKIHNDSETSLRLYEIEDWLPEGMTVQAFYAFNPEQAKNRKNGNWGAADGSDKLNLGKNSWCSEPGSGTTNNLFYEDAYEEGRTSGTRGIDYDGVVKHQNPHAMIFDANTYRLRVYTNANPTTASEETVTVKPGGTLMFGVISKVTGMKALSGEELVNRAGFITDGNVKQERETGNDCTEYENVMELPAMEKSVGGRTYKDDYKAFTSEAAVTCSDYTPGITKELSQFMAAGTWETYDPFNPPSYFAPTDYMRWTVTLYNGFHSFSTAGDISDYTISDTLPAGISYNYDSDAGNKFLAAGGKSVNLPKPDTSVNADGKQVVSWYVSKTDTGYRITGGKKGDAAEVTDTKEDLSIPANGTIAVQIETKPEKAGEPLRYGTYENRADLIPGDGYSYRNACAGELEETGENRTVYGTAQVNIYGSGRTEAWKEICGVFDQKEHQSSGKDLENFIYSDCADEDGNGLITYRLNIQNKADTRIGNLVIMDRLPDVGDNGLVNNSKRYSDFKVEFAEKLKLSVSIDGFALKEGTDYRIFFGKWSDIAGEGSAASDEQWKVGGIDTGRWSSIPSSDSNTMRVEITDEDILKLMKKESILTVSFQAKLPGADTLQDLNHGTAWNSFGYAYKIGKAAGSGSFLTVEPAMVGVKIPTAELSIRKEVESPIAGDDTRPYKFMIEKKEKHRTLSGGQTGQWTALEGQKYVIGDQVFHTGSGAKGGEFFLSKGQEAEFTVIANHDYRVKELDADGFVVKVTPFTTDADNREDLYDKENPPEVLAGVGKRYFCTFFNIKNSLVLPETGGLGTERFHMAGIPVTVLVIMMFAVYGMSVYSKSRKKGKRAV